VQRTERIKFLVYTSLFGVLWGAVEALLGSYLHLMQFPLRGAVMAGVGASIMCVERFYTPRFGASLATGLAALSVKLVSIGGFKFGPVVGILLEAFMVELVLSGGGLRKISLLAACLVCCLEGIPHFFVSNWIIYGKGIFATYLGLVKGLQEFFGLGPDLWKIILLFWIAAHVAIGLFAGWFTINVAKQLGKYES